MAGLADVAIEKDKSVASPRNSDENLIIFVPTMLSLESDRQIWGRDASDIGHKKHDLGRKKSSAVLPAVIQAVAEDTDSAGLVI